MTKLVIVESPAKARTIEKYLGTDFKVAASVGHVVDLPQRSLGVEVEKDFRPHYEILSEKKQTVAALKKAATQAEQIYLAPDPDREGEAIAWHIAELLRGLGKPMRRVLINEITRPAVLKAINEAGELNKNLFEAQQARRILDRLVGYLISPLLSQKFRSNLSAGRVQSVALRLVVERERAIRAFQPKEYWTITAKLAAEEPPLFSARLAAIAGKPLEIPERFNKLTNTYEPLDPAKGTFLADEEAARQVIAALREKPFTVSSLEQQERKRNPYPPFITSTLQQEAARKLGFTAEKTMSLAQRLYEGVEVGEERVGLITYMRTDSPRVAEPAQQMAREFIVRQYGEEFLPSAPPVYKSKKKAQEAHEAIRPTSLERTPQAVQPFLERDLLRLYELIFLRFVASQMAPAVYDQTLAEIQVEEYLFRASGRVLKFKGFLAVYEEAEEGENAGEEEFPLPPLKPGQVLQLEILVPEQHFTRPPGRFTEASLVKELEERGIGRPSTYAAIISTIQKRRYVKKEKKQFVPTPLGEGITDILVQAFPDTFDVNFTAKMEEDLDKVEEGSLNWVRLLQEFYGPFDRRLAEAAHIIAGAKQGKPTSLSCPLCGNQLMIKMSRFGEFLGCSTYPQCTFTSDFSRTPEGEIMLIEREQKEAPLSCDQCGQPMVIRRTRKTGNEFLACSAYPKCRNTREFERDEKGEIKLLPKREEEDPGVTCDQCGQAMVIRRTRKTGREFLACSAYPKCKNTREFIRDEEGRLKMVAVGDEVGVCPECGRPMVLKRGRRGNFRACSGYPECKKIESQSAAASSPTPLPDEPPCELCGRPMVRREGRFGPFISCSGYPECKNIRKQSLQSLPAEEEKEERSSEKEKKTKTFRRKSSPPEPLPDEPPCELCGRPMLRRVSRFGPFISCSGYPECKNIRRKKKEEKKE